MSDADATPAGAHDAHDDGHSGANEALGPVDVTGWAYALAGSLLGLLVVLALFIARGG